MTIRNAAFTLVELMTALAISLLLLLGVIELFRHVGGTIQQTQSTLNMSSNLNAVASQLRDDLKKIDSNLAHQPGKMVNEPGYTDVRGYLEIIEGMNLPYYNINNSNSGEHVLMEKVALNSETNTSDLTVGDVDDILMFTTDPTKSGDYKFRGLVGGAMLESMLESESAEIIYFVRGNTLYRRVLLIAPTLSGGGGGGDLSVDSAGTPNSPSDLKYRCLIEGSNKRYFRAFHNTSFPSFNNNFPFPLHYKDTADDIWYYLRLPLLDEDITGAPSTFTSSPPSGVNPNTLYWDFWNLPNSPYGSGLGINERTGLLSSGSHGSRVGEDIVLKNVLSFDVKVWNPYWVPLANSTAWAPPQFVDLGQDKGLEDENGNRYELNTDGTSNLEKPTVVNYSDNNVPRSGVSNISYNTAMAGKPVHFGFTTKGHYGGVAGAGSIKLLAANVYDGTNGSDLGKDTGGNPDPNIHRTDWDSNKPMPCVFDSWTKNYEMNANDYRTGVNTHGTDKNGPATVGDSTLWACPPPYPFKLEAIQVTIRCFDPDSKHIRQIRVVHYFKED